LQDISATKKLDTRSVDTMGHNTMYRATPSAPGNGRARAQGRLAQNRHHANVTDRRARTIKRRVVCGHVVAVGAVDVLVILALHADNRAALRCAVGLVVCGHVTGARARGHNVIICGRPFARAVVPCLLVGAVGAVEVAVYALPAAADGLLNAQFACSRQGAAGVGPACAGHGKKGEVCKEGR